jgi:hypothetical protein
MPVATRPMAMAPLVMGAAVPAVTCPGMARGLFAAPHRGCTGKQRSHCEDDEKPDVAHSFNCFAAG